jgi:hypothetical protein
LDKWFYLIVVIGNFQKENEMDEKEKENLAVENALNAACSAVQNIYGITDGGWASVFFSGKNGENFKDIIKAYIKSESYNIPEEGE